MSVRVEAVKLETATGFRFAPESGLGLPVNASASSVRLCRVNVRDRGYTVRWHPITVEAAAAGMLRSRHEQHRELGINLIDNCTHKTWLLARLLSFNASTG